MLELAHTVVLMCTTSRAYLELQGRQFLQISTIWLQQQNCASFLYMYRVFPTAPPIFSTKKCWAKWGALLRWFFLKRELLLAVTYSSFWYRKLGGIVKNHPVRFFHQVQSCSAKVVNGWLVVGWYGETFGRISTPCPTSNQPPLCIRIMI